MLIGVPASGKSTWRLNNAARSDHIESMDDYSIWWADQVGITYHQAVRYAYKDAKLAVETAAAMAFLLNKNVIKDSTNTTVKSRRKSLARVPSHYHKTAVYFTTPLDLLDRLQNRSRFVPYSVVEYMLLQLTPPTLSEGFDRIVII